ncbi:TetR/AcrR family transcriptional regulator, partial [Pseudomonas aeruginosa]|nr:TetR/AcrR family transcriptional regulator [Pseudomonas aeruginosa]
ILAALEGAVAVARVERSFQALDAIEEELQALLPA